MKPLRCVMVRAATKRGDTGDGANIAAKSLLVTLFILLQYSARRGVTFRKAKKLKYLGGSICVSGKGRVQICK